MSCGIGFGIIPCCIAQQAAPAPAAMTPRPMATPPMIAAVEEPSSLVELELDPSALPSLDVDEEDEPSRSSVCAAVAGWADSVPKVRIEIIVRESTDFFIFKI